jgi:hypothetical protein
MDKFRMSCRGDKSDLFCNLWSLLDVAEHITFSFQKIGKNDSREPLLQKSVRWSAGIVLKVPNISTGPYFLYEVSI